MTANPTYNDLTLQMTLANRLTPQVDAAMQPSTYRDLIIANYTQLLDRPAEALPLGPEVAAFDTYRRADDSLVTEAIIGFPLEVATSRQMHIVVTNTPGYSARWQLWMLAMDTKQFNHKLVNLCDPSRAKLGKSFDDTCVTWLEQVQPKLRDIMFKHMQALLAG